MKRNVLLVDDDQLFLGVTARGIETAGPEFHVIAEQEAELAIECLKSEKIEILITDLIMPSLSGCDLVMFMLNNKMFMPVIVMSGYVENEAPLATLGGTCTFLSKPMRASALVSIIRKCLERKDVGQDKSVSLITVLQLFALEARTCTLKVEGRGKTGTIVFTRGKMTEITVGNIKGEQALNTMLSWSGHQVEVVINNRKK